ncbi:MAG: neutral zinc metallopeptidase [Sphingomonadaceae bacterium]
MRLDDERESSNIENRRGRGGFGFPGGGNRAGGLGGGGGLPTALLSMIFSRFGILGVVVVVGGFFLLNMFGGGGPAPQMTQVGQPATTAQTSKTDRFVAKVLATTEESWGQYFAAQGQTYPEPTLVLFAGRVQSACGSASSASGPFYCPGDRKIYLDTSFFDELSRRFGAPGDFAAAYVIAHEVGHHVQTVTGLSEQVQRAQRAARSQAEANQVQVRMELQADCFAGVWAAYHRDLLDRGDFPEGVRAAEAIGDDTLQRQAQGHVVPDSFTHGTAEQRVRWLTRGFEAGNPEACDSFSPSYAAL